MKKKYIFWIIVIIAVIVVIIYTHYVPVWTSISNIIAGGIGIVLGWVGHILYEKYIKIKDIIKK